MDIMDSSDTPSGGVNTSSSSALPLSVDQRDSFASPTNRSTYGGQQPTSSDSFSFSSGGSAFDRVDMANRIDDSYNSMPTSTDDMPMPHIEYASHPSVFGNNSVSVNTESSSSAKVDNAKAKAADMADNAKAKASDMADSAKAKAADLKDKTVDAVESAKLKVKSAHLQDRAEGAVETVKDKLEEGAEKVKVESHRLLDMAKSKLHSAEDKLEHMKDEHASSARGEPRTATAPTVKSTMYPEKTDIHPDASSTRDAHLIAGMSSLATHGNENTPAKEPLMTDSHHNALMAGEAAHARAVAKGDDPAQRGGFLSRMHDKLEDGAEVVKDRVDGFLERNVRSDHDEHLSAANTRDLPTLVDGSNEHNVDQVRAKMHPSQERGSGVA